MPGCLTIFCSHSRAWEYFAETVIRGNENNFMARKCGSLHSFDIDACLKQEVPMGYACPNNVKGNFFLRTNDKSPFGKYKKDSKKDESMDDKDQKKNVETTTEKADSTTTDKMKNSNSSSSSTETPSSTPQANKKFILF